MAEDIVEHKFVQIYSACESITTNGSGFWESLVSHSDIAVSHSCEKLFTLVTVEKKLDLLQTIQGLQNLILTTTDNASKIASMTRLITRLLIYNDQLKEKKKLNFYHTKTNHDQLAHPFTTIVKQKPTIYYTLLDECEYVFNKESGENATSILEGFISSIFLLTELDVDAGAMLTRLNNIVLLLANRNPKALNTIYETFVRILYKYPLGKGHDQYFMVLDFLLWMTISLSPFYKISNTNDFLFLFFDRLLTVSLKECALVSYLYRLERIVEAGISDDTLDVVWSGLSYALLHASTLEEQRMIMDMMKSIVERGVCHISVLRVGYLPLYQLMSELNDKNATAELKDLKINTLDMIAFLEHPTSTANDTTQSLQKLQKIMDEDKPYGFLTHVFVYLNQLYNNNNYSNLENETYVVSDSSATQELNMLFSTPFVHSEDAHVQCQTYTLIKDTLATLTCYKFPVFLFLLRSLQSNADNPRVVTHIFKDILPDLAASNDPIMTSKLIQVILSCIQSSNYSAMACLGVKALVQTCKRQSRVWQELKRVFTEWVLRRKSVTLRRRMDMSNTGPIKMELAILTSMRDLCKDRPRECASDVLPMVMSLLQSCQDLSMASLSIIVSTINHCVNAGLVEARSIWNIAVVYLSQYALDQGVKKSTLLIQQLCVFYSIAGAKDDISEPYIQFKETILNDYILPLVNSGEPIIAEHAMKALSNFPAQDTAPLLPEKASDYVKDTTPENDCPNANQHLLFTTLVSNELDHMRRGLFKEEHHASKQSTTDSTITTTTTTTKHSSVNDAGQPVGERELAIRAKFTDIWDTARVAPGLRSGYAIAMLHMIDLPGTPKIQTNKDEIWDAVGKTKWYRFMITQFTDITLTDHLLLRISSVGSWEIFFKNTLFSDSQNDMEAIVGLLVQDLSSRLERSTVPGVTCNIVLATTGLVSALRVVLPSFAASCAADVVEKLMRNYVDFAGSPLSHSAHLMSEEVQFAARFALGYLAPCVMSNETHFNSVFRHVIDAATTSQNTKYRNIDTAIDLVQFANGYSAGHLVAALTTASMTDTMNTCRDTGMQEVMEYCRSQTMSDSRVMGILMGLASASTPEKMDQELAFAVETVQSFLSGDDVPKGRLFGSLWLVTAGAKKEDHIDYELSSLVESALARASSDPNLAQHFYHFTVCYTQIQYHTYLFADASSEKTEEFHSQAFAPLLNSIETDDASSNYRIASLFGMGCLLGLYANRELLYLEAQRYAPQSRQAALDKLSHMSGLTSRSALTGNLKSGRVAAAVCGKVIEHVMLLQHVLHSSLEGETTTTSSADAAAALSLLSASSEPTNYNRLNHNTSYLRAIYDRLVELAAAVTTKQENNIKTLITSLIHTPGPLPAVNWFNVLVKIAKVSPELQELCFSFAAKHGTTSFSLSEFLMTQVTSIVKGIHSMTHVVGFLFGGSGALDALLTLSGLLPLSDSGKSSQRRGMSAVVKKISLSSSRLLELIQLVCQRFQWLDSDTQRGFLTRVACHVSANDNDEDKQKLARSVRDLIYESITVPLLQKTTTTQPGDVHTLELAVACGVSDIQQLLPTGKLSDWQDIPSNDLVFNRVVALCKFHALTHDKQHLTRYLSVAMIHLIAVPVKEAWSVLADRLREDVAVDNSSNGGALGWTVRLFDAFVVYLSAYDDDDNDDYNDATFTQTLRTVLHRVLQGFVYSPLMDPTRIENTVYLVYFMVDTIGAHNTTQQEQIVKRVFKMMDMTKKLKGPLAFAFLEQIARSFPKNYVVQYESNY